MAHRERSRVLDLTWADVVLGGVWPDAGLRGTTRPSCSGRLRIFAHRVNDLPALQQIVTMAAAHSGVALGVEADVQRRSDGRLEVAHRAGTDGPALATYLDRVPGTMPLVLELKDSVAEADGVEASLDLLARHRPTEAETVLCTFHPGILADLEAHRQTARIPVRTCLLSFLIRPHRYPFSRLWEHICRQRGKLGGPLPPAIRADLVGIPWRSAEAEAAALRSERGVATIAGDVDSARALNRLAGSGVYGIFTDRPRRLLTAGIPQSI